MATPTNQTQMSLWQKLMEIQKGTKPFGLSEDSDKIDPKTGRSSYRYTPGWQIVENVKTLMDNLGLMLIPDFRFHQIDVIEYPVYKMIGDSAMSFTKKEMHIAVDAAFTWIDTATGEQAGPFHIAASGANGTDKSTASALALAERYFLLKFFHLTTRDADDEPDAHDSDNVPGIPKNIRGATPAQACGAGPVPAAQQPYSPQGYAPVPAQGYAQPQAPGRAVAMPAQPAQQVNVFATPPQYMPQPAVAGPQAPFNESNPAVREAVDRLMMYERGTVSHAQVLNEYIGKLSAAGVNVGENSFVANLAEAAQARRENRPPRYV